MFLRDNKEKVISGDLDKPYRTDTATRQKKKKRHQQFECTKCNPDLHI